MVRLERLPFFSSRALHRTNAARSAVPAGRPVSSPAPLAPLPKGDVLDALAESRPLEARFKELAETKQVVRQRGMLGAKVTAAASAAVLTTGIVGTSMGEWGLLGGVVAGVFGGATAFAQSEFARHNSSEPSAGSKKAMRSARESLNSFAAELKDASPIRRQVALHYIERGIAQASRGENLRDTLRSWVTDSGLKSLPVSDSSSRVRDILDMLEADFLAVKDPWSRQLALVNFVETFSKLPEQDRKTMGEVTYRRVVEDFRFDSLSEAQKLRLEQALMPYAESDFEL